ncbi:MAG TPA: noncanonical pyrimidine nucleotidase, YjjG family [Ruminococcaceae bacterium]|nr:noncanonical pyrimidine nucleotidase, YjjG family [Oscillospiraceae bacterium]
MIRNILLDLDDTLLDFKAAEKQAVHRVLTQYGVAVTEEILQRYSQINDSQWKRLERGEITVDEVKVHRYELLFEELGVQANAAQVTKDYEGFLAAQHPVLPGARVMMEALFGRYRLYLVSNGTARVQNQRLDDSGFRRYFDGVFLSQDIGFNKPNPAFFDACFEQIEGFDKAQSVILGDSLTSDILGGNQAGICTVWYNPHGKTASGIQPSYQISSLTDFVKLVEKL